MVAWKESPRCALCNACMLPLQIKIQLVMSDVKAPKSHRLDTHSLLCCYSPPNTHPCVSLGCHASIFQQFRNIVEGIFWLIFWCLFMKEIKLFLKKQAAKPQSKPPNLAHTSFLVFPRECPWENPYTKIDSKASNPTSKTGLAASI